jgi:hypothetical protein
MLGGGLALFGVGASPVSASVSDVVTNLNDAGSGSLRAAILDANSSGGGAITFQAGLAGTITLASNLPPITQPLTITGPGASAVAIDGASNFRMFYLTVPQAVTISGLTLQHSAWAPLAVTNGGTMTADSVAVMNNTSTNRRGGGFYCHGTKAVLSTFTLTNSTVTGNSTTDGGGGGFAGSCNATVATSTIANNAALGRTDGGGLYFNSYGNKTVENSTISGNTAADNSGGVYVSDYAGSTMTISNTTISGNSAVNQAGGIGGNSVGDKFSLIQSTLSGNMVTGNPNTTRTPVGGLYLSDTVGATSVSSSGSGAPDQTQKQPDPTPGAAAASSHINIVGSIVWGNTTSSPGTVDIGFGSKTAGAGSTTMNSDHSLLGTVDPNVTIIDQGGTLTGTDPMLGPLANNGGPTQTEALLAGSPAIDKGPNPLPTFPLDANDQRGDGFPRVVGPAVDIGAFEVQPPPAPTPAPAVVIAPKFTG